MLVPAGRAQTAPNAAVRDGARVGRGVSPWRGVLAAAILSVALGVGLYESLPRGRVRVSPAARTPHRTFSQKGLLSLPAAAQGPIAAALGADSPAYRVRAGEGGFRAASPAQHLSATFTGSGVSVTSGPTQVGLRLNGVGYGSSLTAIDSVAPRAHANRVVYPHPGVSEWYANGPLGVEQGFTLTHPPAGRATGPLTLSLALSGNAQPTLARGGHGVTLSRAGKSVLRYTGLTATDARGHSLHSWLQLQDGRLLLRVDSTGARYPLRIDPLIQQGSKLTANDEGGAGDFGERVALSSDGNTALIGGGQDTEVGAAWVFTRSGETWTQQGPKLTGSGASGFHYFGSSVALSSDGNTALIGSDSSFGGAWVFTRSGSTWTQQGSKLEPEGHAEYVSSVALSSDGNTALIGSEDNPSNNSPFVGAAWVFTRSGETWTRQGPKLTGSGETGQGAFGSAVALSSDGNTALIGGYEDNAFVGAAWVFTRSGETWTQQGPKLTGTGETRRGYFGESVALSSDGNTALIGGPAPGNQELGAAWVFSRFGSTWKQQGSKLTGAGRIGQSGFGNGVALSSDGNTALIGGYIDNEYVGAAWVYTRSGETWTQQGPKLVGGGETRGGFFGFSVALSSDGNTALIGGINDNLVGAAWVFANQAPRPTVTSVKPTTGYAGGGTKVTIKGTGFLVGSSVKIGNMATSVVVESPTKIKAVTIASAPGSYEVVVTDANGPSTGGPSFTYVSPPPPVVESVKPTTGFWGGGTTVTLKGKYLQTTAPTVDFGSNQAAIIPQPREKETKIVVVAPPSYPLLGLVPVTVTTASGTSNAVGFTYVSPPPPVVESVSRTQEFELGGQEVTIRGKSLDTSAPVVDFGSNPAVVIGQSTEKKLTVTAPQYLFGFQPLTVMTASGTSNPVQFQYVPPPPPVLEKVTPTAGTAGTEVTIKGQNFVADGASPRVFFGGYQVQGFVSGGITERKIVCHAPAGPHGTAGVSVVTDGGATQAGSFTYPP